MRIVFGAVLLLGLGLAGFAVYMARNYITANDMALLAAKQEAEQRVLDSLTEVIVASEPVRYGDRLTEEKVTTVMWPRDGVPEGSYTVMTELFPEGQPPRTVLRALEAGEAIMQVKVTEPGEDAGVGSKLAPGMRAFALRVDVASGVSGFLRPGDRVDVYWTGNNVEEAGGSREFTKLIQPNIKLIAVDQTADEDVSNPTVARTVTVEATPSQVAALAQAQATGTLQLSLVGAQEQEVAGDIRMDQSDLLGIEETVVEAAPEKKVCSVRTRRGGEMVDVQIACPE